MNEVWSPAFLFELNAREVIDNVPQLSRIFLGRLNYVQLRIPTKSPRHSEMMSPGVPT
jgi:hypothetical protein